MIRVLSFKRCAFALVVLAVAIGVGASAAALLTERDSARSVEVRVGESSTVVVAEEDAALRIASESAGFRVVAAGDPDFRLDHVWVQPAPPPGPPGSPPRTFRVVTLTFRTGNAGFQVDELNGGLDPAASGERVVPGVTDSEVYFLETETAFHYSMLSRGRGFILVAPKPQGIEREVALAALSGIASQLD